MSAPVCEWKEHKEKNGRGDNPTHKYTHAHATTMTKRKKEWGEKTKKEMKDRHKCSILFSTNTALRSWRARSMLELGNMAASL